MLAYPEMLSAVTPMALRMYGAVVTLGTMDQTALILWP
jgi:hypothetical protein